MYCNNCGTEIQQGQAFCPGCGAQVTDTQEAQQYQPQYDAYANEEQVAVAPENNKNTTIIAIAVALVVVILGIIFIPKMFGGPKKVAKKYAEAYYNCDYAEAYDYYLYDYEEALNAQLEDLDMDIDDYFGTYFEELEKEYDVKIDSIKDLLKYKSKYDKEENEDEYGKYKVKVEVKDCDELKDDELEELKDQIDDNSFIEDIVDADKIKKAYEVEVDIEIEGKEDDTDYEETYTVVKYGGKWKVMD